MRRALVATATLVVVAIAPAAAARTTPSLRIVGMQPLVVRGLGFHAGERTRVTLVTRDETAVRRTIAGTTGAFRVSFAAAALSRCSGFNIIAVGNRGSKAEIKRPPLPECAPE